MEAVRGGEHAGMEIFSDEDWDTGPTTSWRHIQPIPADTGGEAGLRRGQFRVTSSLDFLVFGLWEEPGVSEGTQELLALHCWKTKTCPFQGTTCRTTSALSTS